MQQQQQKASHHWQQGSQPSEPPQPSSSSSSQQQQQQQQQQSEAQCSSTIPGPDAGAESGSTASDVVYLIGPTPSFTHAVWLGLYRRQQDERINGKPTYVQERPPSAAWEDRVMWYTRNGEWTASWRSAVEPDGQRTRGFLTISSAAPSPDGLAESWYVAAPDGTWVKAPYVRCLSGKAGSTAYRRVKEEEEAKRHSAAPRLTVSMAARKPDQHDDLEASFVAQFTPWLGEYHVMEELVNGRQAYTLAGDASRMMWFSVKQGYWVLGWSAHVGSGHGKAFAEALNKAWFLPEHLAQSWRLFDDNTNQWRDLPLLRVRPARNGRWRTPSSGAS